MAEHAHTPTSRIVRRRPAAALGWPGETAITTAIGAKPRDARTVSAHYADGAARRDLARAEAVRGDAQRAHAAREDCVDEVAGRGVGSMTALVVPFPGRAPAHLQPILISAQFEPISNRAPAHLQPDGAQHAPPKRRQDRLGEVTRLAMLMQPHVFDTWVEYAQVVTGQGVA